MTNKSVAKKSSGTRLIWGGVVVLIILRQDFWFWDDPSLVLGMFPIGLAWQVGISIAAAILWYTATRIAWPAEEMIWHARSASADTSTEPRAHE